MYFPVFFCTTQYTYPENMAIVKMPLKCFRDLASVI